MLFLLISIINKTRAANLTSTASIPFLKSPAVLLHRWAGRIPIGAEHAAIALLGAQHRATSLAVVEELTGVGRHSLGLPVAALRAGDNRQQFPHVDSLNESK